ncbi:MAG: hypothetical protein K6G00_00750 [Treponema sp.]|nr:hypothetical protein [Treponema sp.]
MKQYVFFLVISVCICSFLSGCSSPVAGDDEQVAVSGPEKNVPEAVAWRIVYGSGFAGQKSVTVRNISSGLVQLQKNVPSYILAYPLDANGQEIYFPYGTIPPFSNNLCPQDGFAASILQELYTSCQKTESLEYNINHFNWLKFMELCRSYENPWLISRSRIIAAIKKGKFKKSDVKIEKKTHKNIMLN